MGDEVIEFVEERETKNAIRFQEQVRPGKGVVVGVLYLKKEALERMSWKSGQTVKATFSV
jgi:hypothetical protein